MNGEEAIDSILGLFLDEEKEPGLSSSLEQKERDRETREEKDNQMDVFKSVIVHNPEIFMQGLILFSVPSALPWLAKRTGEARRVGLI